MSRIEIQSTLAVIVSQDGHLLNHATDVLGRTHYQVLMTEGEIPSGIQPHLIIFDWSVPLTPEWEQLFSRSIVIAVLPEHHLEAVDEALDRGVHEIMRKPLNPRLLSMRLRTLEALYRFAPSHPDENARRIFNLVADYVYILSVLPDGQRQRKWADEERLKALVGYNYEQIDKHGGWSSIVHPDDQLRVDQHLQKLRAGNSGVIEYRVTTASGEIRWLRDYSEPIQSDSVTHIFGAIQDVTSLKILEAEQEEQRRILDALHNIAIALNSTLNFDEILDRILMTVGEILPHDLADVMLVENGIARIARHRGYLDEEAEKALEQLRFAINERGTREGFPPATNLITMMESGEIMIIDDVTQFKNWIDVNDGIKWERAYIGAPIFVGERLVGFLNLTNRQPNIYTQHHAHWLRIFASHVAAAIGNAQLYDSIKRHSSELEDRIRDLVTMHTVGQALTSTLDPSEIYRLLFDEVVKGIFNAHSMSVLIIEEETRALQRVFTVVDGEIANRIPLPLHLNAVKDTIDTHKTQTFSNTLYEPLISRNRVIGVLVIQLEEGRHFDDVESTLFSTITSQAAIALENAHLMEEIRLTNIQLEQRVAERTADLLKALEKERELTQLKSRFVSTVSHEFRTPLTAILSANEMLENYNSRMDDEQKKRRYELIRNAVADMVRLLDDSITMNQVTSGTLKFSPEMLDVVALSREVVETFAQSSTHQIVFTPLCSSAVAAVDKDLWKRILRELLLNAVKYSKPHTRVECILDTDASSILLKVSDEGVGIPPGDMPRIFDMFHRGLNVGNTSGTGLGLPIVKYAVELHNGSIDIEPAPSGTIVKVRIPGKGKP